MPQVDRVRTPSPRPVSRPAARPVLRLLLAALLTVAAAAFAQDEPVTLTFVNWIGAEEATADDLDAMLAAFEAEYPDIDVETIDLPFNQTRDQLLTMSLGGTPPDVSMVHTLWLGAVAEADVLTSMDGLLPNLDDWFDSTLEGKRFGDELLFVTWAPSPIVLYYNRNLLEQAGYDAPPATWAEMTQMARDIAALGDDIYGIDIASVQTGGAGFYFLGSILWNFGGDLIDADGNVAIGGPATVEALTYAQDLFASGVTPTGLEIRDFRNLFAQGKLGFHFDGEFGVGIIEGLSEEMRFGEDFGVAQIPGSTADAPGQTFFIEHTLAIFEESPHKREAGLLVDFLTGPQGLAIYNDFGGSKLPARASSAELPFYQAPENAFMQTFIEALQNARPLPASNSSFAPAMEEIGKAVQRVAILGDDPQAVASDLQQAVEELYRP